MLTLEHISWSAPGGDAIIKDISAKIDDGKLVVVTGPNGGGKTTLAKIIAGIETPDTGKIYFDGKDITDLDVTQRAKLGISFAFQQPVRFKGITVRDLLELAAGKAFSEEELCDILGKVGLCTYDYMDREINAALSGGEIKRIEIASVLARNTKLSIFDEPEAGIDLWSFNELIGVFEDMRSKRHGTQMIISHQERILQIADEILVIADGKVRTQGDAKTVLPTLLQGEKVTDCPAGRVNRA